MLQKLIFNFRTNHAMINKNTSKLKKTIDNENYNWHYFDGA